MPISTTWNAASPAEPTLSAFAPCPEQGDCMDLFRKRILVTGGNGFLGGHIVARLESGGARYVFAPRHADCDLTRPEQLEGLFRDVRPEVVIHAAALVGGIGANRTRPAEFFYVNALMGIQLIEAARRHGVEKLVVLGTICSYPKLTPVPFCEDDLWSGYPEETNAPYGIAKKALIVQCQAYRRQYGLNAVCLLPVNLYGPGDNFDTASSHVIPSLIRKCVEAVEDGRSEVVCWGDGSPTREFLYVEDAAGGIVAATRAYNKPAPVNLGSGVEISIRALAQKIAALTGFTGRLIWDSSKPGGQPRRSLDVTRAYREFDFQAMTSLECGLGRTVSWYLTARRTAAISRRERACPETQFHEPACIGEPRT
jgi:GDP-L-fucose synthase